MTFSGQTNRTAELLADDIAAAIEWWRDAGVDCGFDDDARDWLAGRAPATVAEPPAAPPPSFTPPPPPPAPRIGGDREGWPQDLAAFSDWWLHEPLLDAGQVFDRIAPSGPANAALMILVDHPEATDTQRLLSGDQGRLLDAILAALGMQRDAVYCASVLPRHMPLPDWPGLATAGLGEVALHHVRLAAPQRLITFGKHVSSLLGHDPAKSAATASPFYPVEPGIPALAAPELGTLMARPRGKGDLWRALLDWQTD